MLRKSVFIIFILLLFASCCSSKEKTGEGESDNTPLVKEQKGEPSPPQEQKMGGFSEIDIDSQYSVESFDFLKKELLKSNPEIALLSVKKAMLQVVAGYNVSLICDYKSASKDEAYLLSAKIYFDLEGKPSIKELNLDYAGN
ncbi:hypothetical protein ES708_14246 [subsurface metagenome]